MRLDVHQNIVNIVFYPPGWLYSSTQFGYIARIKIFFDIPFLNQKCSKGEPQAVSIIRQGEASQVSFDLEMELDTIINL
ncbi:hypothetical protein SAMN05428978_101526 [Nitrosomonas sp. Nm34]|nr:hypothetical protein SAMN05428978_101526 [Nitrosomonas sp. Nm34]